MREVYLKDLQNYYKHHKNIIDPKSNSKNASRMRWLNRSEHELSRWYTYFATLLHAFSSIAEVTYAHLENETKNNRDPDEDLVEFIQGNFLYNVFQRWVSLKQIGRRG